MSKDYRKSIIPKDHYMCTIVHANYDGNKFYLWWVVDTGKHVGHKVSQEYPCTDFGDLQLRRLCKRIRIKHRGNLVDMSPIYPMQYPGKRGRLLIDISHENNFIRNIITHHEIALSPPEENVLTSRTVTHFYQEQNGRRLPI